MVNVLPSSPSRISVTSRSTFVTQKNIFLTRCSVFRKSSSQALPAQKYILPLSTSVRLFPEFRIRHGLQSRLNNNIVLATGADVAVEEAGSAAAGNGSEAVETQPDAVDTSEKPSVKSDASPTPARSKRPRPVRKSEMPPVKNEELVPGATFTGKVRSIQPFGAFVDFGAFTDGLVHVSRLSDSFVKDVNSVVSVGQEVTVRLVEANMETGRISLTMRDSDDSTKVQQQRDSSFSNEKSRTSRKSNQRSNQRNEVKKTSKFVKGQDLLGTVKNLTRSGAFISLLDGEEGFLPHSEEANEGFENIMGGSSLQVGEEVNVRVLRINRGQVTLTMKKEEDAAQFDSALSQGVVHTATNPFVLAFRSNKDISAFLDDRTKEEDTTGEVEEDENKLETAVNTEEDTSAEAAVKDEGPAGTISDTSESVDDVAQSVEEDVVEVESKDETAEVKEDAAVNRVEDASTEATVKEEGAEGTVPDISQSVDDKAQSVEEESVDVGSKEQSAEVSSDADQIREEAPAVEAVENIGDSSPPLSLITEELPEKQSDDVIAKDEIETQTPVEEKEIPSPIQDGQGTTGSTVSTSGQIDVPSTHESPTTEGQSSGEIIADEVKSTIVNVTEQIQTSPLEDKTLSTPTVEEAQNSMLPQKETAAKGAISPALVKQLREETGAGMMDCKKALSETEGDIIKAQEYLRKKGLASAEKKAARATAEGRIGSYIHDSRIGVLIEVNCETDFVSRGEIFKELVDDLAMQVAACPQVQYLVPEDVPQETVVKEREIEMQKEDLLSKPEQIRSKIVEGRIRKRLEELALLEQPYIKNDKVVIRDWVKQTIATIGENIKVKRFVRYNLGEGLEKKSQDFAAEVAAQTASKPTSLPAKDQSPAAENKEDVEKASKTAVSAALVKQLREETGAGMMDCKKALSETGGDIEKAQEYLRKKGLSTADKKSSRLAAEGRIGSYIHDSRIGVLIEVNCETDFVGRSAKFKELVDDLAMQVVASPQVQYVSVEDIPESITSKEKELEMQREDLQSKPENIREKIVEGRVSKRVGELALLEQPFIKDDSILVKDLVKQTVAALGENIKVRRFVRFTLGESSDQKSENEAQAEQE